MRKKDDYADFQDRMFQEIEALEELEVGWSSILRLARAYGLTDRDIIRAYQKGMSEQELKDAMKAIRKK